MMVKIDGSPHRWLGGEGPELTLLAAIDDATGKVLGAVFRQHEDAQGYFLLMRTIVEKYGCPLAVYRDRHGIFQRGKNRDLTIAEQLEDQPNHTQFCRLLEELRIESIPSHSPQGKGRIERLFGTFQDRLVSELRLAGIENRTRHQCDVGRLLAALQPPLCRPPATARYRLSARAHRNGSTDDFSFKYLRTVGMDNTLRFHQHHIQIEPDRHRVSYAQVAANMYRSLKPHSVLIMEMEARKSWLGPSNREGWHEESNAIILQENTVHKAWSLMDYYA
jgi:hypothetical protein